MSTEKQYKLLMPLPDGAQVGDEYFPTDFGKYYNKRMYAEAKGIDESLQLYSWQVENNPNWFQEVKPKEWQIEMFKSTKGFFASIGKNISQEDWEKNFLSSPEFKIYSIKRISDGEVFSIGDEIGWGEVGNYQTTLKGFVIKENKLYIQYDSQSWEGAKIIPSEVGFVTAIKLHKKPEQQTTSFQWTDELVLMIADIAHHNGWHRNSQKIVDLFDEVKKQASGAGYMFSNWIKKHVANQQSHSLPKLKTYSECVAARVENSEKLYTQSEMNKAREEAFEAGREIWAKEFKVPDCQQKYLTAQDYIDHIKSKK